MIKRNRRVIGVILGIIVGVILSTQIRFTVEEVASYNAVQYEFFAADSEGAYIIESDVYKAEDVADIIYISEDQAEEWGITFRLTPGNTFLAVHEEGRLVRVE